MEKLTSKQKIDQLLGIESDQSIDSFLEDLSEQTIKINETFQEIELDVKDKLQEIDKNIVKVQSGKTDSILALQNMELSMKEIEDMIDLSKKLFKHIYMNITSSDLIDSELIAAAAKMLESIHINIAEFIQLYRDKQHFIEKIKVMIFQQEQKKELMKIKHQYDMEKLQMKNTDKEAENAEMIAYSIEDITRIIHQDELKEK